MSFFSIPSRLRVCRVDDRERCACGADGADAYGRRLKRRKARRSVGLPK